MKPINDCGDVAIDKALSILAEHYQNIVIFVNYVDDNGDTFRNERTAGNFFANRYHIENWLDNEPSGFEEWEEEEDDD